MQCRVMTPSDYGAAVAAAVRAEMGRQDQRAADLAAALGVSTTTARTRMSGAVVFDVVELLKAAPWLAAPVGRPALTDQAGVGSPRSPRRSRDVRRREPCADLGPGERAGAGVAAASSWPPALP